MEGASTIAWLAVGNASPPLRRSPGERLLAWIVTGPVGHLWSVVADVGTFAGGLLAARAKQLVRGPR
jgi:hypothetical protein